MSDGTKSAIWRTGNITSQAVGWTKGTEFDGIYTVIRAASPAGGVLAYAPNGGSSDTDYDFAASDGGWNDGAGSWSLGTGWQSVFAGTAPNTQGALIIDLDFTAAAVLDVTLTYSRTTADMPPGPEPTLQDHFLRLNIGGGGGGGTEVTRRNLPLTAGVTADYVIPVNGVCDYIQFNMRITPDDPTGITLTDITIRFASGSAVVRYSSDNGATVGSEITVGDTSGGGGFDVQHNGTVSYASALNVIKKATTLGGSYSTDQSLTDVSASVIEIPWYTRNSLTALNSGSSPEYIFGLSSPDGSGNTLYWVVSGTPVNITPMFDGNPGIAVSPNCITTWKGRYIAGIFNFLGTFRVMVSIDGGDNWSDCGGTDTAYIRVLRQAGTPGYLVIAGGETLKLSTTFGNAFNSKARPSTDDLIYFEPIG